MADTKISGLTALTGANAVSGDLLTIVDISDTTMAATGTNKKITLTELQKAPVSAGTANGVLYLNGSKVATSGSALVFDSSNRLGIGVTPISVGANGEQLQIGNAASTSGAGLTIGSTTTGDIQFSDATSGTGQYAGLLRYSHTNDSMQFWTGSSEQMRLTSTGLTIGSTSAIGKLGVWSAANGDTIAAFRCGGTGSQRGLYISADNSTGVVSLDATGAGAGILAFKYGATEAMRITTSGNLGIGTTSPNTRLTIGGYSSSNQTPDIQITRSSSGTAIQTGPNITFGDGTTNNATTIQVTQGRFGVWNYGGGVWAERMSIDASGNMGLGVTPSAWASGTALQVLTASISSVGNSAQYMQNAYYNAGYKYIGTGYATLYEQNKFNGTHNWFITTSGTAGNAITFTQAMTLDSSGNLGIGTTSIFGKLNIADSTNGRFEVNCVSAGVTLEVLNSGRTNAADLGFYSKTFTFNTKDGGAYTEKARIDSSGNFGIAPNKVFGSGNGYAGNSSAASSATLELWDTNGNTKLYNAWGSGNLLFGTGNTERARIDSSGNLLVGTTSNAGVGGFTVAPNGSNGSAQVNFNRTSTTSTSYPLVFSNGGTLVGSITFTNTATAFNTSSDYRLKNNPQPLTGSGAFIDALQPKTWNWKADGSKGVGFIAHEVQEVSPNSVVGEKDGEEMQAMEYGSAEFIANIIAELQSLRARVAALES
jgi:hypothetical protein